MKGLFRKFFTMAGLFFLFCCAPRLSLAIPAFPGAEGFGSTTPGGRGGTVIKVTSLDDSGAGTLRAAVEASGPRIIVFEVSGIINLISPLNIGNPYITIAGQTSPGGIIVAGHKTVVHTTDVIIRHMRFRVGSHRTTDGTGVDPGTLDAFNVWGDTEPGNANDASNIIIDHCSFSWGIDENFSISYNAHDITVQWSIFAEGLTNAGHPKGNHSKNFLSSGKFDGANNISVHHNYFSNTYDRNPRAGGPSTDFTDIRNNVAYNYEKGGGIVIGDESTVNAVQNYLKPGPLTNSSSNVVDINYWDGPAESTNHLYLEGNISPSRPNQSLDDWVIADGGGPTILTSTYRRATPWPAAAITQQTMPNYGDESVALCILNGAGARAPVLDAIDFRNIQDFVDGTQHLTANAKYLGPGDPGEYPIFATPAPPADTDDDGMPDSWEDSNGYNKNDPSDAAGDSNGNGYTNIEEYLNYLPTTFASYTYNPVCMPVGPPPAIKSISIQ